MLIQNLAQAVTFPQFEAYIL